MRERNGFGLLSSRLGLKWAILCLFSQTLVYHGRLADGLANEALGYKRTEAKDGIPAATTTLERVL